jgi:hypothetical protein
MKLIIYNHQVFKLVESGDKLIFERAEFILPADLDDEAADAVECTRLISA